MRLVPGEYHRPARQFQQPGHDVGHRMVMVRVAAGGQPGPPPDRHQPDPPVQRPRADLRPAQVPPDPGKGPRPGTGQGRTVAGWHPGSAAICAGAEPCSDSSTITARVACRHRPCGPACSCSVSLPGPSASTLTGRILITTSPAGRMVWQLRSSPRRGSCQSARVEAGRPDLALVCPRECGQGEHLGFRGVHQRPGLGPAGSELVSGLVPGGQRLEP